MSSLRQHLNFRYQIAFALAAAFFLVLTTTAQSNVGKSHKQITLAFVLFDATNPVSVPARKGAEDAAKKYGFTLRTVAPSPTTAQAQIGRASCRERV